MSQAGCPDPTAEGSSSPAAKKMNQTRKLGAARVIKSRFKEAAARAASDSNSSRNISGKNSFGSSTTLTNSGGKVQRSSSSAAARKKVTAGSSSNAVRSLARHQLYASCITLNNSNNKTLSSCGSSASGSANDSAGGGVSSPRSRTSRRPVSDGAAICGGSSSSSNTGSAATYARPPPLTSTMTTSIISNKLHSTAVNATMLNTTIIPGSASQASRAQSKNLFELPDISAIKLDMTTCSSGKGRSNSVSSSATPPLLSVGEEGPLHSPCDVITEEQQDQEHPVTADELQMVHLNYLTWCHLNASASSAHTAALTPATKEVCFLEELVSGKQREASELRQKLQLLETLKQAKEAHQTLMPVLQQLNDGSARWCEGLTSLAQQLEHHLHHVVLSPALLPDTPAEVSAPLRRITATLQRLLGRLHCRTTDQHTADAALRDAQTLQRCFEDVQEASRLALQKCSLQMAPRPTATAS